MSMSKRASQLRAGGVAGLIIGLLGLGFVTFRVVEGWPEVSEAMESGNLGLVVPAVLIGIAGMALIGLNWQSIIGSMGAHLGPIDSLFRYFVGQLGKYVPGGAE